MPGITRVGGDTAGGVIISSPNGSVFANGQSIATNGSVVAGHGDSPHNGARMVTSSGTVFAQGIGVCRSGDSASCGHIATGSGNVNAG